MPIGRVVSQLTTSCVGVGRILYFVLLGHVGELRAEPEGVRAGGGGADGA
jgi:hypothetical protein